LPLIAVRHTSGTITFNAEHCKPRRLYIEPQYCADINRHHRHDGNSDTFSGIITGVGGLTKNGSGTLTLSGTNLYLGGNDDQWRHMSIGGLTNLGGGTSIVLNGGTLQTTSVIAINRDLTLGSSRGTIDTKWQQRYAFRKYSLALVFDENGCGYTNCVGQ